MREIRRERIRERKRECRRERMREVEGGEGE